MKRGTGKNFVLAIVLTVSFCCEAIAQVSSEQNIPKSLAEAIEALDKQLPSEEKEKWMAMDGREAVVLAHFGLGMWMRNNWGLWSGSELSAYFNSLGISHPDDMSGIILKAYWHHLNKKPFDLESEVACHKSWLEEMRRLEEEARAKGSNQWKTPDFSCD